ncbi:HAD-IIIA family hydrolase [Candidatus Woesearchaeota archaeon]|nr:HAD-IIIA family hydrolase [Candidatus Woesearchaeota archaeon]
MLHVSDLSSFTSEKILTIQQAAEVIKKLKQRGKAVGLCHGGFDLLHPGHILHFESAKKWCDVLVVSITSDRFVASRKGDGRPVFSDKLRAYMAAAVSFVNYVVITDIKGGTDVINYLKPSYYIKGPDFINKATPGISAEREAIQACSGEMRYTNDVKLSTTDIIQYIKERLDVKRVLVVVDRDGTLIEDAGFLGREENWKEQVALRKSVVDLLLYIQTKYKATMIVATNQTGVARGYYSCEQVEDINRHINQLLQEKGIAISAWEYCPDADAAYAELMKGKLTFNPNFVKAETKRKPAPTMVHDALQKLSLSTNDFSTIIVIGDREEDQGLAKALKAHYIDASVPIHYEQAVRYIDTTLDATLPTG